MITVVIMWVDKKTLGESGRGRVGELEWGGEEGRGALL